MGRMTRGFRLAKASWTVLRDDAQLIWLPVIATLAMLVFAAIVLLPLHGMLTDQGAGGMRVVVLAAVAFVAVFISVFANASIVAAATDRMHGGRGSVSDGLRLAWSKVDKIIAWSALSATVGLVLRVFEERGGAFGAIVGRLVGAAWSAITFFVVPVILFEPVGTIDAVKRSGSIFRQRWGEQFVGNASIGIVFLLGILPVAFITMILAKASIVVAVVFAVIAGGGLAALTSALSGVFNAALYQYAVHGTVGTGFTVDD